MVSKLLVDGLDGEANSSGQPEIGRKTSGRGGGGGREEAGDGT